MWGQTVSATFTKSGWGLGNGRLLAEQARLPWLCCLHPSPRPPPFILHMISGHHIRKSGAGWGRRGEGLGANHSGGRGWGFFCRLNPARLGAVALGVASEETVYCPKMDGWLQWWLWRELMWFKMAPPPFPKTCSTKNFDKRLATQKIIAGNRNFHFQLDYKNAFLKIIPKLRLKKQNHSWKHWMIKNV